MKFDILLLAGAILTGDCSSSQVESTTKSADAALGDAAIIAANHHAADRHRWGLT